MALILLLPVAIVVYIVSLLLVRLLSRYRELSADRGSAIITGHPSHLINALLKISGVMQQVPTRDLRAGGGGAMNQFYIIPQIRGRSIIELFSTHPSLEKRIRAAEAHGTDDGTVMGLLDALRRKHRPMPLEGISSLPAAAAGLSAAGLDVLRCRRHMP